LKNITESITKSITEFLATAILYYYHKCSIIVRVTIFEFYTKRTIF